MRKVSLIFMSVLTISILMSSLTAFSLNKGGSKKNKITVINGNKYFENTLLSVDKLGGMKKFVKKGQKVGLLINSDFEDKGTYVHPDVAIAAIKMCFDAGASEVVCLQHVLPEYWQRSTLYDQYADMLAKVRTIEKNRFPAKYDSVTFIKIDSIPGGKAAKKLEVVAELFKIDVFINVPIAKHHATTMLTCAMKNMMGLNTRATNVTFHLNGPKKNDPGFMGQCLTDMCLLRKPDLIIVDATEVLVTNGPSGPGELKRFDKVVAGTDIVAVDTYCGSLLGYSPEELLSVQKGYECGLGEKDLAKVKVLEIKGDK